MLHQISMLLLLNIYFHLHPTFWGEGSPRAMPGFHWPIFARARDVIARGTPALIPLTRAIRRGPRI